MPKPDSPVIKYKVVIRQTCGYELEVYARSVLEADQIAVNVLKEKLQKGSIIPASTSKLQVVSTQALKGTNVSEGASK